LSTVVYNRYFCPALAAPIQRIQYHSLWVHFEFWHLGEAQRIQNAMNK
jgi:hypothetical protein